MQPRFWYNKSDNNNTDSKFTEFSEFTQYGITVTSFAQCITTQSYNRTYHYSF